MLFIIEFLFVPQKGEGLPQLNHVDTSHEGSIVPKRLYFFFLKGYFVKQHPRVLSCLG